MYTKKVQFTLFVIFQCQSIKKCGTFICLNDIPTPLKHFKEMNKTEFNTWLSKANLSEGVESEKKFKIKPPSMPNYQKQNC